MKTKTSTNERIYYLDWLRVLAFWLLILFHSWQPFNHFDWYIKCHSQYKIVDVITIFTHGWRMHLIFFISGVGTWFAIRSHKNQFFKYRYQRLIVPFIMGSILITPAQLYFHQLQAGEISEGFLHFMINYPDALMVSNFGFNFLLWLEEIGRHLWYLPYLMIMTVILYPFFKKIRKNDIEFSLINKILDKPFGLFILVAPIFICQLIVKPIFPASIGWADFLTYIWLFIYGFIFINNHTFYLKIIKRNKNILLIVGIVSSLALIIASGNSIFVETFFNPSYNEYHLLLTILNSFIAIAWTLYFVAIFSSKFKFGNKILELANRSILPIYVLHQSVIIVIGFYILQFNIHASVKFSLIVIFTCSLCVLFYIAFRRNKWFRFLFGMK